MPIWKLNGTPLAALSISAGQLIYGNLVPDTFTFTHHVPWSGIEAFAGATTRYVLTRDDVPVFVGIPRAAERFHSAAGEGIRYTLEGPWNWLQRRALIQDHMVVVDPATSTVPTLLPQGFALLSQDDGGSSISVNIAITDLIDLAIASGLPILRGYFDGLDHYIAWDEVADLTVADAIIRLLASAPDAVCSWDYTTMTGGDYTPTINIGRRATLTAITLDIAPEGAAAADIIDGTYASFVNHQLKARADLIVPYVRIIYRRINQVDGVAYLQLEPDEAGSGSATSDNALVRTITLAGSTYTSNTVALPVTVRVLSSALTASGTTTSGSDFDALVDFWKSKHAFLADAGVTITEFRATGRRATDPTVTLNTTLGKEIMTGGKAPWMTSVTTQDQTYTVEVAFTKTLNGSLTGDRQILTAGVLASDADNRTYSYVESSDYSPPEPTPVGLASSLYAALGVVHYEGSFSLIEPECALTIRPQHLVNFSGGATAWATMNAVVQSTSADLDSGTTTVQIGFPAHLGPTDLVEICRSNRLKKSAETGLIRTTGVY